MTEKEFQRLVVDYATLHGWMHYHTHDSRRSTPGFPDLVLVRERIIFAEQRIRRSDSHLHHTRRVEHIAEIEQPRYHPVIEQDVVVVGIVMNDLPAQIFESGFYSASESLQHFLYHDSARRTLLRRSSPLVDGGGCHVGLKSSLQ